MKNWLPAVAGLTCVLQVLPAQAEPGFARLYKQQYGYTPSCHACHKDGGGTPVNAYGQQFKDGGRALATFAKIGGADADGDGASNDAEAKAKANPGAKASTPAAPGAWLASENAIPREVQDAFPGIRTWLPRDALLTEADVARAKALGAELGKADENTIYVPVENQKPAGTAIIFPAHWRGKDFFLLLATDRQLRVTRVQPLHASKVPEAERSKVYASFSGVAVNELPPAQGDSLDAAITRAVKKAATLLYVRLKTA